MVSRWHNVHTKFHENLPFGLHVEKGARAHEHTAGSHKPICFLNKVG